MVSPKPLSDFVPDVTLIAFPIPKAQFAPRGGRAFSSREPRLDRAKKMVLMLLFRSAFRSKRKPEFAPA
jgi:hypothetical protein